jgi:hypothetical protein
MKLRILGPFQLEDGGRQVTIGGVRQRAVLARLSLQANEVVPSEQLLVDLWGEDSPPGAANALQAAISRLRRVLPPDRLITKAAGYVLRIFPDELDVMLFERLLAEGRDALAAGAVAEAARTLGQALSLCRVPRWPISATNRRTAGDRPAGGTAPDVPGGAGRGGSGSRLGGCTHGRAAATGQRASDARASSRPAHARPLPQRPTDRSP